MNLWDGTSFFGGGGTSWCATIVPKSTLFCDFFILPIVTNIIIGREGNFIHSSAWIDHILVRRRASATQVSCEPLKVVPWKQESCQPHFHCIPSACIWAKLMTITSKQDLKCSYNAFKQTYLFGLFKTGHICIRKVTENSLVMMYHFFVLHLLRIWCSF